MLNGDQTEDPRQSQYIRGKKDREDTQIEPEEGEDKRERMEESIQKIKKMDKISNADVIAMFEVLLSKVETVKTDLTQQIESLRKEKLETDNKLNKLEENQKNNTQKVNKVCEQQANCEDKVNRLRNMALYQNQVINELNQKVEGLQKEGMSDKLVIKGIMEKDKEGKENCMEVVKHFFKHTMEIEQEVHVKRVYRMGKGKV